MTKIKKYTCKGWIALNVIIKHSIKIIECCYTKAIRQAKKVGPYSSLYSDTKK